MESNLNNSISIEIPNYSGPLNVLLDLAKSQKVDLANISITKLADQFLYFIKKSKNSLRSLGGADSLSPADQKKIVSSLTSLMYMTTCDLGLGKVRYGQGYSPGISRQLEQALQENHHAPYNCIWRPR